MVHNGCSDRKAACDGTVVDGATAPDSCKADDDLPIELVGRPCIAESVESKAIAKANDVQLDGAISSSSGEAAMRLSRYRASSQLRLDNRRRLRLCHKP